MPLECAKTHSRDPLITAAQKKILQTQPTFIFSYFGFKGEFSLVVSLDVWTLQHIKQMAKLWTAIFSVLTGQVVDLCFGNGNSSFCMEDWIKLGKRTRLYQLSISGSDTNQCAIVPFTVPANKQQITPFIMFILKLFWVLHRLLQVPIAIACSYQLSFSCNRYYLEVCVKLTTGLLISPSSPAKGRSVDLWTKPAHPIDQWDVGHILEWSRRLSS